MRNWLSANNITTDYHNRISNNFSDISCHNTVYSINSHHNI